MGWGTYLYTWRYFSRCSFNDKSDVEEKLEETKRAIKRVEDELKCLVFMTEPRKFIPEEDCDDPTWWLNNRFEELIEELQEYYIDRDDYELLLNRWDDCHDKETGLAIPHPDEETLHSYMDGDFVATTKRPNPNEIS